MKSLLRHLFFLCCFAVPTAVFLMGCSDGQSPGDSKGKEANAKSEKSDQKGEQWVALFDGKNLDQWRNFKKKGISDKWEIQNGELTLTGKGGGDIITKKEYGSFELKLDYKISEAGNSGLMYHVTEEEDTPWRTGPEIQIQDNVHGHDPQKAGWLYQLYSSKVDATKPVGQWNEIHILITPEKCVQWMNGTKYCEYVKGSKDWQERVAKSKFSKFPKFGKATKGHICLQDHGNKVSFRNIRIREIE